MDGLGVRHPAVFFGTAMPAASICGCSGNFWLPPGRIGLWKSLYIPARQRKASRPASERPAGSTLGRLPPQRVANAQFRRVAAYLESAGWRLGRLAG